GIAKAKVFNLQESLFCAFHREGDGRAGGNGVEPKLIAPLSGAKHDILVRNTAQRPQCKQTLVLETNLSQCGTRGAECGGGNGCIILLIPHSQFHAPHLVNVLAPNRAGGTRVAGHAPGSVELLARESGSSFEGALLKVARWQSGKAIEREQVGDGAKLAILG